jgi:CRP-like cAMP-binding protein
MREYFEKLSFFDGADVSGIDCVVRNYEAGSILYYEGDVIKAHFLVAGSCKAIKYKGDDEIFLYSLSAGLMISDVSAFALSTVEMLEDSVVLSVDVSLLVGLSHKLLFEVQKRNAILNDFVNLNFTYDVFQKVAYMLLNDIIFFNRVKRSDIAKRLNIKNETLSRALKKLQVQGYITISDGFVSIIDRDRLQSIFA